MQQESFMGSGVQLVNVNFSYGKKQILHNLSIDLSFGICGLLGPNGAGKTTLLNVIATIYAPSSGKLFVHGFDVTCRAERAKARSNMFNMPHGREVYRGTLRIRLLGMLSNRLAWKNKHIASLLKYQEVSVSVLVLLV